jgi:hypothetical protein
MPTATITRFSKEYFEQVSKVFNVTSELWPDGNPAVASMS